LLDISVGKQSRRPVNIATFQVGTGNPRLSPRFYRPELDALRLLSFLLVFGHHLLPRDPNWLSNDVGLAARERIAAISNISSLGLCLFFFLSAFLISELLLRERECTGTVRIGLFYQRRILRIWPLYYFAIAIGLVWAALTNVPSDFSMFGYYLIMVGNWCVGHRGWSDNPMTPLWSISIEEQFYLLWPLIIAVFTGRQLYAFAIAVAVAALTVAYYLGATHADLDYQIWTNSFVQFLMFSAGTITAVALKGNLPTWPARWRALLCIGGFTAWFVAVVYFRCKLPTTAQSGSDVAVGYALVALGCTGIFLAFYGIVRKPPAAIIYLGKISFGLYVYHLLSIQLAQLILPGGRWLGWSALALGLTIALAALSYRFIETPFLRLKQRKLVIQTAAV
jgi:peptidoglycan/LPS O-acetylase OafA/YrhL